MIPVSDEQERERLGRIAREAWAAYWRRDKPTHMESWDIMASVDKEAYCVQAEAVADAILPEGTVAVERGRLERLRLWAEFGHRIAVRGVLHYRHRALVPQTSLVPGDLDLLPEPADKEGGGG